MRKEIEHHLVIRGRTYSAVHKLKNEMFVMSGKIKGKTLLPIPEHLGSLDGTLESMERSGPGWGAGGRGGP